MRKNVATAVATTAMVMVFSCNRSWLMSSACLSVCLYVCLSVCLSVCLYMRVRG